MSTARQRPSLTHIVPLILFARSKVRRSWKLLRFPRPPLGRCSLWRLPCGFCVCAEGLPAGSAVAEVFRLGKMSFSPGSDYSDDIAVRRCELWSIARAEAPLASPTMAIVLS